MPQGPEFGNEFQRHHSGWFIHEFEGRGYTVHGTTGTRYLRGYMAEPRWNFPGCLLLDEALTLDPTNPYALAYRAVALWHLGRREASLRDVDTFTALLGQPPESLELLVSQGLLIGTGD